MQNLSVVVTDDSKRFVDSLLFEAGNEFCIDVKGDLVTFCDISDKNSDCLCAALAKAIINQYEKHLLVKAINKKCTEFSKPEKVEIWKIAFSHLYNDFYTMNQDYLERLNMVKVSLCEYLRESDSLFLQGFVNFRLSEYMEALEELAEISAEEFIVDCEYKEFVMMLKYFVSLQKPKYVKVSILYGKQIFIFGDGKDVTKEYEQEYKSEIGHFTENKDDFVLNSLILIAPEKIKLITTDDAPEKEFVNTLISVFENKISIN